VRQINQKNSDPLPGRRPRRIVTVSGRGVRGVFPSRKSRNSAQFESLTEATALLVLEVAPSVTAIATQPRVFAWFDGTTQRRYTPDIAIEVGRNDGSVFLEVKDDTTFTRSSEAVARLLSAHAYLRNRGHRLHVLLRSELRANDLPSRLESLLVKRPMRGPYRSGIDSSQWDPENHTQPCTEIAQRWRAAQRECDELILRVLARGPDDLLSTYARQ
jgi:hypothetical protein